MLQSEVLGPRFNAATKAWLGAFSVLMFMFAATLCERRWEAHHDVNHVSCDVVQVDKLANQNGHCDLATDTWISEVAPPAPMPDEHMVWTMPNTSQTLMDYTPNTSTTTIGTTLGGVVIHGPLKVIGSNGVAWTFDPSKDGVCDGCVTRTQEKQ